MLGDLACVLNPCSAISLQKPERQDRQSALWQSWLYWGSLCWPQVNRLALIDSGPTLPVIHCPLCPVACSDTGVPRAGRRAIPCIALHAQENGETFATFATKLLQKQGTQ